MHRRIPWLVLVAGTLGACAGSPPPPQIEYLPPTGAPAKVGRALVQQPRDLVWGQLVDRLQQSPLQVEQVDAAAGIMVATYRGDPQPYVDCGWIVTYQPQELTKVAGATREAAFAQVVNDRTLVLNRDLELAGRLVVQVQPQGFDTVVAATSTYVLTKRIAAADQAGRPQGHNFEVVSFTSGGQGEFRKGTVCQPTGELELTALGALPSVASVGAGPSGPPRSMPVIEEAALACTGEEWAFCQVLEILRPYRQANQAGRLGLAVQVADGSPILRQGQELTLDVSLPGYDAYLHVAYIQRDGVVGHVVPGTEQRWPANARRYVEDTGYEIAEPYGVEMIVAIAAERPLFPQPRPRFEPVESYLQALRQGLGALEAQDPAMQITADHLFVRTEAGPATVSSSF